MTLEECISGCEQIMFGARLMKQSEVYEYNEQLTEWLRELKEIKHLFSITEKLLKANFRDGLIDVVDGYDILFSEHKQLREIFEEVDADERR